MSDVFISYARSSEDQARQVEELLRALGYGVWRDAELPAHRTYADVIEERLKLAKAVVVLWSAEATKSQWVRAEADAARELATLVQASLDATPPPLPFNQIQWANLHDWDGDADHAGWRKLHDSVETLAGKRAEAEKAAPARGGTSVCVLPFQNMSGDAEQEYFSDGISEDITTDLSKVSALSVTARNTAFTFKGQAVNVGDVAKKLGVSHVLEGSVRKAGNRVRITAQLIDGASGDHIWAQRFDRDLTDIFAIQDEISNAIVESLKVRLLPEEKKAIEKRCTCNVAAYEFYLIARQTWISGSQADSRREEAVIRLCDRVIQIEPGYGRAWALKALAVAALHFGYNRGADDGLAEAERALELDPSLAEAYSVKARVFAARRQFDDAEKQIEIALRLDPDSWEVNREGALIYHWAHKFADSARLFERCIELDETDRHSLEMLAPTYRAIGDEDGIRRTAERLFKRAEAGIEQNSTDSSSFSSGAQALIMLGDIPRAKEWIDRALLIEPDSLGIRYNFACTALNHSDEVDLAFEHLEYVFERSVGSIVRRADIDTDLDRIRDDPRFRKIYAAAMERIARLDAEAETVSSPAAASEGRPHS